MSESNEHLVENFDLPAFDWVHLQDSMQRDKYTATLCDTRKIRIFTICPTTTY